ncbi:MAG: zinc-binding dehydrogenase, partial [Acidimicrobiia bacterium]|nr:zinc-binding dehydrogenase [Acidimicrobiia bacterium]
PELDPLAATVVPDAVATPVHVAGRAGIGPGDRVVVLGAGGGVGIHMVQVARLHGAEVAGFDITDGKLAEVERHGGRPVDSTDFSRVDPAAVFPEGKPTVVVDFLGAPEGMRWAIEALASGGRLVALTTFRERPIDLESREMVFGELTLLGSRYARKAELAEAARLVASGAISPVIGSVVSPGGILDLHDLLRTGGLIGRGALDWRDEHE